MPQELHPVLPSSESSRRRRWLVGGLIVGVVLALVLGIRIWRRPSVAPPLPDLAAVDPEVAEAVQEARRLVIQKPSAASAWGRLGMVLRAHDFGPEANRCFQEAERLDPREARWPYVQGLTLVLTEPEEGIRCLERAVERCGDSLSVPQLRLAEALLEQGRLDEAQSHLEQVLRREPENCRARLGLGRLAILRENWQAGLDQLEACLADEHARKLAYTLRAEAWARLGQPDRARTEQQRAAELPADQRWPDPFAEEVLALQRGLGARLIQADALARASRWAEATGLLKQTLTKYPQSIPAWLRLGEAWRQQGQLDQAEEALQRAVQADPEAAEAWFRLGCVQALGRPREAADSFRRAIRLKPDHALAHFNLAHRLKELGDPAGAAEEFRAVLRCRPDYAPAQAALTAMEKEAKSQGQKPKG
jgi:tetratricopeptide (TPR) repeat protein